MLLLSKELIDQPVLSLQTGRHIATTRLPIINPRSLKIVGWWCTDLNSSQHVLLTEDVREFNRDGIIVNDQTVLCDAEDLIRLQEILEINFEVIDKLVKTKHRKLGKVSDYCFDESYIIQKIYVSQSITKAFGTDILIIGRDQIVEVTDQYIVVRDGSVEETKGVPLPKFAAKLLGNAS